MSIINIKKTIWFIMRIKELREEKNLTQNEVAQAIHTSQKNISRWENGENEPTSNFIIRLADFFQCSTDYLLERSDDFGNVTILSDYPVSPKEQALLKDFRALSDQDRLQATDYIQYLAKKKK